MQSLNDHNNTISSESLFARSTNYDRQKNKKIRRSRLQFNRIKSMIIGAIPKHSIDTKSQ